MMRHLWILLVTAFASAKIQRTFGRHPRVLSRLLATRGGEDTDEDEAKLFPALTEEEIAEKLNTIPVFGITYSKGQSVVTKMADGALVNHVFLNKQLAEYVLNELRESARGEDAGSVPDGGRSLQVTDVPLGMLWNKLAVPGAAGPLPNETTAAPKTEEGISIQLRLFPDPSDLQVARNMTATMDTEIQSTSSADEDLRQTMADKAARLQEPWGVVPVFTMSGMKIRVRQSAEQDAPMKELLPWFLSIEDCVKSSKKAVGIEEDSEDEEEMKKLAGMSINMSTLNELVSEMAKKSAVDFRNVIFMPPAASIEHMKEKIGRLMKERGHPATLGSTPEANLGSSEKNGIYDDDDDDDDDANNPFASN